MRQQQKIIIWPSYFDSTKTRKDGRRVTENLAVASPRVGEVKEAAEKVGLVTEIVTDTCHPKTPWLRTGMLLVVKRGSKEQIIKTIGKQLSKIRSISSSE
jgi:signal recognition particle subunit SRP19